MQWICRASEFGGDVRCPVCGQGFQVYWTRKSPQDQPVLLSVLMEALGRQHLSTAGTEAHAGEPPLEISSLALPVSPHFAEAQWGYC